MAIPSEGKLSYARLIKHNVRLNGLTSLIYARGLSSARFIEYKTTLEWLREHAMLRGSAMKVLDVGCGCSLFPSLLKNEGYDVTALDLNKNSMVWQKKKGDKLRVSAYYVMGNGFTLPFRDCSFDSVVSISALEHIVADSQTVIEMIRILKDNGICIISVPVSLKGESIADPLYGVPRWGRRLLGAKVIMKLMKKLNVDRSYAYLERFYSKKGLLKRIANPSICSFEKHVTYWDWLGTEVLFRLVPKGTLTILEFLLAKISHYTKSTGGIGGTILKLRKA